MFTGRVVGPGDPRKGIPADPQWLPTDLELALAWQRNKAETCPGCGTRADEWDADPDAYISDHSTCEGCARLQQHQANNLDRIDDTVLPGQHAFLVPRELHKPRPPTVHLTDDD